jgi:hypothetical protein
MLFVALEDVVHVVVERPFTAASSSCLVELLVTLLRVPRLQLTPLLLAFLVRNLPIRIGQHFRDLLPKHALVGTWIVELRLPFRILRYQLPLAQESPLLRLFCIDLRRGFCECIMLNDHR